MKEVVEILGKILLQSEYQTKLLEDMSMNLEELNGKRSKQSQVTKDAIHSQMQIMKEMLGNIPGLKGNPMMKTILAPLDNLGERP